MSFSETRSLKNRRVSHSLSYCPTVSFNFILLAYSLFLPLSLSLSLSLSLLRSHSSLLSLFFYQSMYSHGHAHAYVYVYVCVCVCVCECRFWLVRKNKPFASRHFFRLELVLKEKKKIRKSTHKMIDKCCPLPVKCSGGFIGLN